MSSISHAFGAPPQLESPPADTPFTFAVIGDYRGDSDGNVPPVLLDIFAELNRATPAFVLSSGDLINGYPEEDKAHIRKLWNGYRKALEQLKPPIFHVPGNHDLFNEITRELWAEFWGPTYYSFDYAGVRFIGLDTETDEHRVSGAQLDWLREQLKSADDRRIFLFFHEPLFPIDGRIGTSLDMFPGERDKLHQLLVEHRDRIEGVFLGHEHLFEFEERDGIRYYISAGSGAPLYVPEEIGGFYHYLLVHVTKDGSSVELRRMWEQPEEPTEPRVVKPGEVLETYEHSVLWSLWDQTVHARRVDSPLRKGAHALQLSFDLTRYEWPSLATTFAVPRDFTDARRLKVDVFVPPGAPTTLKMKATFEGVGSSETPEFQLDDGWNTFAADLSAGWLAADVRRAVRRLQLAFEGRDKKPGLQSIRIGDVRIETGEDSSARRELVENWESPLQWGIWDESVHASQDREHAIDNKPALKFTFDFTKYQRPRLFAALRPNWDVSGINQLSLEVFVPEGAPPMKLHLAITSGLRTEQLPPYNLRPGGNHATFQIGTLPRDSRKRVRSVEWWLESTTGSGEGWISIRDFHADKVTQ